MTGFEGGGEPGLRHGAQAEDLAAGGDGGGEALGAVGGEEEDGAGGRLFEGLEEGVGGTARRLLEIQ